MSNKRILFARGSLAYQQWGSPTSTKKVLAIHGWLDNSNSFNYLGPYLAKLGYHVVAYDNIGHGYSSHETASSNNYSVAPYVGRCRAIMDALEWDKCNIVGHSLGASLAVLFAGSHPDRVQRLAAIDGFSSPLTQPAERAAVNLRKAIDMEVNYQIKQRTRDGPKLYDTLQNAILARINSVSSYPGEQTLSVAAATTLVARGVSLSQSASITELNLDSESGRKPQIAHHGEDEYVQDMTDLESGPVYFRHDTKLFLPAHSHFTKYQVMIFIMYTPLHFSIIRSIYHFVIALSLTFSFLRVSVSHIIQNVFIFQMRSFIEAIKAETLIITAGDKFYTVGEERSQEERIE